MSIGALADIATEAVASIEDVASRIEDAFAQVGNHLGSGHAIFLELNHGLDSLSQELSGTKIEGASVALQDIAAKLNGFAQALPAESALLGNIGESAVKASSLLKSLTKQIEMITIIARSARIEAASFDEDQGQFLDFTREAFDLAKSVHTSIEGCARDQILLSEAIVTALNRQWDFENRYRAELLSVSADLTSAYSGMRSLQDNSAQLAGLTGTSTKRIAEAVGSSIISLQAGDSTRQRLEHICHGLRIAAGSESSLVPDLTERADCGAQTASLICRLQSAQLEDTISVLDTDVGQIRSSLNALLADATGIIGHGRSLYGGQDGDAPSFLTVMKRTLAEASALIATCESARRSVDDALSVVENTLGKFRHAIFGLSETVVDIILIGMNAGLKAGHLGAKGSALVVIADELKATADHISNGARLLRPVLDGIERSANDLKHLRVDGDPSQLAKLESSILPAILEIEVGNDHLGRLMNRLVHEGAQFEGLITSAQAVLTALGKASATLPTVRMRLQSGGESHGNPSAEDADVIGPLFDELYTQYTMVSERDVHLQFLRRAGLPHKPGIIEPQASEASSDDVLFF
jgi:hypothetical protein